MTGSGPISETCDSPAGGSMPGSRPRLALGHELDRALADFVASLTDARPLGVAVSGGSDSLGLLYGLSRVVPGVRLVGLTVDHGLRPESADEARQVKSLCRQLGLRHETLRWSDDKPDTGLQAAARDARYRLLGDAARRLGLSAVLTAHTADDQIETLRMRRARDPDPESAGLSGIPRASLFGGRMWVLRPLLAVDRATIRARLVQDGVGWLDDPSNCDRRFERVRVRQALARQGPDGDLPDTQWHNGDGREPFRRALEQADLRARHRHTLAREAAGFVHHRCACVGDGHFEVDLQPGIEPQAVLLALRALIGLCGGAARALDRHGQAKLEGLAQGSAANQTLTLGRVLLRRNGAELTLQRERRGVAGLSIPPGGTAHWDGRYRIRNLHRSSVLSVVARDGPGQAPLFSRDCGAESPCWGLEDGVSGGFSATALIGRYARVLPVQEAPLAQALADLVGEGRFPACPWPGAVAPASGAG